MHSFLHFELSVSERDGNTLLFSFYWQMHIQVYFRALQYFLLAHELVRGR